MLLYSSIQHNGLNLNDFAAKLIAWLYEGHYTPDGVVFDCGIQTHYALQQIKSGVDDQKAVQSDLIAVRI